MRARKLTNKLNYQLDYEDSSGRLAVLDQLLGGYDRELPPFFEPPLHVDYGSNIFVGKE